MKKPVISLIAAIGKNRELGKDNKLIWHVPEDMKRFKQLTKGHVVIMGRNTYESIGRPLPDRVNIIITHDTEYNPHDCIVVNSLGEAIGIARRKEREEIFIIGGGQIYKQSISQADRLYLTIINESSDADTFFPDYSEFTKVISQEKRDSGDLSFSFLTLERS